MNCQGCGIELEPPHAWCWDCFKAKAIEEANKPDPEPIKERGHAVYVVTSPEVRANYQHQAQRLSKCVMQPGSYEKRFVRDIASIPVEQPLTDKQMNYIDDLLWKYRRQLGGAK